MPLAYPSTLDRRPADMHIRGSASYVEELWSPSLVRRTRKGQAKANANALTPFRCSTPRVFLSQAGPRFHLELVQAEHHLVFDFLRSPPKRRRRPVGVALDWLGYAASGLARMPPSEGGDIADQHRVRPAPAGLDGRQRRRPGKVFVAVDDDLHGVVELPRRRIEQSSEKRKCLKRTSRRRYCAPVE